MQSKERSHTGHEKEGTAERGARFLRNVNALGALAWGSLAIIAPVGASAFSLLAGVNVVQAGGFEWARRYAKKKRQRREARSSTTPTA